MTLQEEINKEICKGRNKVSTLRRRKRRVKKWFNTYIEKGYNLYFSTFTFKDEKFNRKQFVDYLRKTCKVNCILNADYGKENNRFHLHGFIALQEEINKESEIYDKYGFTFFKKAKSDCADYIVKYSVKIDENMLSKEKFRLIIINLNK